VVVETVSFDFEDLAAFMDPDVEGVNL